MNNKKILLVTGASSEIGRALIEKIRCNYSYIWAHYHNEASFVNDLNITPVYADFMDIQSTESMIQKIYDSGKFPDNIVHISAIKAKNLQFHKYNWQRFNDEINTSLRSITLILQKFIPVMAKNKHGRIIFILSSGLLGMPPKFQAPYITVKYALFGLMRSLASEYASKFITVNAVSPDMIETKFLSNLPEIIKEQNAANNPLNRNIIVDDIIPAIEYLLSDSAQAVTGQNIAITGGIR